MVTTTRGHEIEREHVVARSFDRTTSSTAGLQDRGIALGWSQRAKGRPAVRIVSGSGDPSTTRLRWLPYLNRAVLLRSAIVAVVIGSVLTLTNQSAWVAGNDPLQLLPFILVFVTPFVVVVISQVAAERRAFIDIAKHGAPASPEGFVATAISHGIPTRAVAIGLIVGSINASMILAGALLHSGDFSAVSVAPLGQAYLLPLLFGGLSQAISYRRAENLVRKAESMELTASELTDRIDLDAIQGKLCPGC